MIGLSALSRSQSRRTNFLSAGVTLCVLVTAVCAAPLAFVPGWIAAWLLTVLTFLALGTFGVWAFHAIKNSHLLSTEEHTEHMAAIAQLGQNRTGKPPLVLSVDQEALTSNPDLAAQQDGEQ